ncbi:MAG: hypothetical protein ABL955_00920 [Elusimicrobiota bacterium]
MIRTPKAGRCLMVGSIDAMKLLKQIHLVCHRAFEEGPDGRALAARLGLDADGFAQRALLGYAEPSFLGAIPQDGAVRDALHDLGFLTKDGTLAIAKNLIVPIMDRRDVLVGLIAISEKGEERRFPASVSAVSFETLPLRGKPVIVVDRMIQALRYKQVGVLPVLPLLGAPGPAEEQFLKIERPQRAYCDARSPEAAHFLQKLEVPCFELKTPWPMIAAQVQAAIDEAGAVPVELGDDAVLLIHGETMTMTRAGRQYELRDLDPKSRERMRVRLRAIKGEAFHLDTIDLFAARSRAAYAKAAAALFTVAQDEVERDLCLLIGKLEAIRAAENKQRQAEGGHSLTGDEEAEAQEYLLKPDLLNSIVADVERLGYVGEALNTKLAYLIAVSRKLASPLSGAIFSRAGAGKSALMDVIADMTPAEDLVRFTRITPQALYYYARQGLRNKLMIAAEAEGMDGSDYVIRELISSKRLKLVAPVNDTETGTFRAAEYEVEGPIALMFSTTRPMIHFENATRCFPMSLDETVEQTRAIHAAQRAARAGDGLAVRAEREELRRLHQNVQRLIKPLLVVNPFAPHLEFPSQPLEMRREHEKYLSLIDALALLHQHQRRRGTTVLNGREVGYVEVAVEDVEEANRLMAEVLGTSRDELARPSRALLDLIHKLVEDRAKAENVAPAAVRFNRRDIREAIGWSDSQIKAHIAQLEDLQYLLVGRGERGKTFRYELARDGAAKRLSGLTDPTKLRALRLPDLQGKVEKSGVVGHGLVIVEGLDAVDNSSAIPGKSPKVGPKEQEGS